MTREQLLFWQTGVLFYCFVGVGLSIAIIIGFCKAVAWAWKRRGWTVTIGITKDKQ